ncbi:hypothetical protein J6590_006186 [Homalodisca vitripennis]|nr:hypothetical protein J6590_006186 [Homalodisca vitripennis]
MLLCRGAVQLSPCAELSCRDHGQVMEQASQRHPLLLPLLVSGSVDIPHSMYIM